MKQMGLKKLCEYQLTWQKRSLSGFGYKEILSTPTDSTLGQYLAQL